MPLTTIVLTRNNAKTVRRTLESARPLGGKLLAADLGSDDETPAICKAMGATVVRRSTTDRSSVLNELADGSEWAFHLQPWEVLHQGHAVIASPTRPLTVQVLSETILTHETRVWSPSRCRMENPVFESLTTADARPAPAMIFAAGTPDYEAYLTILQEWRGQNPTLGPPVYYHALCLLALRRYDEFLRLSEHFMFLDTRTTTATILNRYYYALVQVYQKKAARPAAQNLAICLATRPLMAEAWCLMGDIYYHLHHDFKKARLHYENATILGSRRLAQDTWPMEFAKYDEYPAAMIASCDGILSSRSLYAR